MDIVFQNISIKYSHKTVLSGLCAHFSGGHIHALLGENGAGKSTVAAIISGAVRPDSGIITADGVPVKFRSQRDAERAGIFCVHQRPLVSSEISVFENICLGAPRKNIREKAEEYCGIWAADLALDEQAAHTGSDGRFYTALISALIRNPKVLILDEPTASLSWQQSRSLYANIRELSLAGINVIVITHFLQEAQLYTDDTLVLRKNADAEFYPKSSEYNPRENIKTEPLISEHLPGKNDFVSFNRLKVYPLGKPTLDSVTFTAQSGIITLIKGLPEDGLGTLEDTLTGMETSRIYGSCTVNRNGQQLHTNMHMNKFNPFFLRKKSKLNTGIVPSDRTFRASNPNLTIEQLLSARYPYQDSKSYAEKLIKKADVSITIKEKASSLSGGMLQRLILARELDGNPEFIIMCEPLQGLDNVSSSRTITLLKTLASQGKTVLVLSTSPFPETECGRVYTLKTGKLSEADK